MRSRDPISIAIVVIAGYFPVTLAGAGGAPTLHLAALTLLLAFYFVTGLVHSHLTRHLDRVVAGEHAAIVAAGLLLVAGARAAGVA